MRIRKFNSQGNERFEELFWKMKDGEAVSLPESALNDPDFTEEVNFVAEIENRTFESRYDMGKYLTSILSPESIMQYHGDTGLWNWISWLWFDQLCQIKSDGSRKDMREMHNYLLSPSWNHRPRHAVRSSWMLASRYGDKIRFMLSKSPSTRGHIIEVFLGTQFYFNCQGVVKTASRLYTHSTGKTFKRGSTSRVRPGNIERYLKYLNQLELTYDLFSIKQEVLWQMLPQEFEGFKND